MIYGILITVAAVLIAPESLAARLAFGAVTLAVLVAALVFAQPVIAAMRWILKRATDDDRRVIQVRLGRGRSERRGEEEHVGGVSEIHRPQLVR